ncbi:MAG: isoprenylcysteine carboxylmethyltransferase family protein [archaeon]
MEIFGKAPINNFMFITGKLSFLSVCTASILQIFGYNMRITNLPYSLFYGSLFFIAVGTAIFLISSINLGKSLCVGIPEEKTSFKKNGLYKFSRNPLYLGFYLIVLSSVVFTLNPIVFFLGIYSIFIHHLITLAEENFLKKRFGNEYINYCKKVRRYL